MPSIDVQLGVATLLEQCAQRRAGVISAHYQEDSVHITRMLQAEAAGRELLTALVRPDPFPDSSLGATLRRLVDYMQTVITASTPEDQLAPLLTTRMHRVVAGCAVTRLLRDAMILLVLTAIDDDATGVEVRLERTDGGTTLTVESDRPSVVDDLSVLRNVRNDVVGYGGGWESGLSQHGGSWMVMVSMPFEQQCEQEASRGN